MTDERRRHVRAQLPAVRTTYETASGDRAEGAVHDIGVGGAFVQADVPLAVGKRIVLEIAIAGERTPVSATGRVAWTRTAADGEARPAGMGVVFVDLDDAATAVIGKLTSTRERTVIGVAAPANEPPVAIAPVIPVGRPQKTAIGVGAPAERERSLPIDLVTKQPPPAPPGPDIPRSSATPSPSRNPALWLAILVVVIVALAYFFRAQLFGTDAAGPASAPARTEHARPPR